MPSDPDDRRAAPALRSHRRQGRLPRHLAPRLHCRSHTARASAQRAGTPRPVANVLDVYAAYNYGIVDPQAIHDYIADAYRSMGTRYVLLVGGDTYDYLATCTSGRSASSRLRTPPQLPHQVRAGRPPARRRERDGIPDLALGRFPVVLRRARQHHRQDARLPCARQRRGLRGRPRWTETIPSSR